MAKTILVVGEQLARVDKSECGGEAFPAR